MTDKEILELANVIITKVWNGNIVTEELTPLEGALQLIAPVIDRIEDKAVEILLSKVVENRDVIT